MPPGLILGADGAEVLLPRRFVPEDAEVGDLLEVFLYTDSEDRPIATLQVPLAQVGDFACLTVKSVSKVGAFLDWGLDKDLLLPFAEQPRKVRTEGERVVVRVLLDEKSGRPIATARTERHLIAPPAELAEGDACEMLLYERTDLGIKAIVNQRFGGLLHLTPGEAAHDLPARGTTCRGFVRKVRDDGKVDLALAPAGTAGAREARTTVLAALSAAGGSLGLGDESTSAEIRQAVGLSKKAFKKAIGSLYRERRVTLEPRSVTLLADSTDAPPAGGKP